MPVSIIRKFRGRTWDSQPDLQGLASGPMRVLCHYAEPEPVAQKALSAGRYCAVVVRRFDGEVLFTRR